MSLRAEKCCGNLIEYIQPLPVIDTHEHYYCADAVQTDPVLFILGNYYLQTDLLSLPGGEAAIRMMQDTSVGFEARCEKLVECCKRVSNTGYYQAALGSLRISCGIDTRRGIDREALERLDAYLRGRTPKSAENLLVRSGIQRFIANPDISKFCEDVMPPAFASCRFAFPLPPFHCFRSAEELRRLPCVKNERDIESLDGYMAAFESYFDSCTARGIVCIKDQSAYMRTLRFASPSTAEAEKVYRRILGSGAKKLDCAETLPLSDWLMHRFMQIAEKHDLPVQLHTGHLAFPCSDIREANAIHLIDLLQAHPKVRFALFHGNWPYMAEILFLLKNYPNVYLDMCWVQSIDPIYSVELMRHAALVAPCEKLCAFGGDTAAPEWSTGYLSQAKENVCAALSGLVDAGYISLEQARTIAGAWLYENANQIYGLGLPSINA